MNFPDDILRLKLPEPEHPRIGPVEAFAPAAKPTQRQQCSSPLTRERSGSGELQRTVLIDVVVLIQDPQVVKAVTVDVAHLERRGRLPAGLFESFL